jgi:hypothetical protein
MYKVWQNRYVLLPNMQRIFVGLFYHDFTDEIGPRKDQNAYIHMECITLGDYYVD